MLFFGRLCCLDKTTLTFTIFLRRLYSSILRTSKGIVGIVDDMIRIIKKYNLDGILETSIQRSVFPSKQQWKKLVKASVWLKEEQEWRERMSRDSEFYIFRNVHSKLEPHIFWKLAMKFPEFRGSIHYVMKIIATTFMTIRSCVINVVVYIMIF